jgi:hypothetical protein
LKHVGIDCRDDTPAPSVYATRQQYVLSGLTMPGGTVIEVRFLASFLEVKTGPPAKFLSVAISHVLDAWVIPSTSRKADAASCGVSETVASLSVGALFTGVAGLVRIAVPERMSIVCLPTVAFQWPVFDGMVRVACLLPVVVGLNLTPI